MLDSIIPIIIKDIKEKLKELEDYLRDSTFSKRNTLSTIKLFENTYTSFIELFATILENKKIIRDRHNTQIPVINLAHKEKIITKDKLWHAIREDRNRTTHLYKQEFAIIILKRINTSYLSIFYDSLSKIEREHNPIL